MPFLPNPANFEKVIRQLLGPGEELVEFFGVPRRVVALTNQRFILGNFPFFAAPKALIDAKLDAITSFDFEVKPQQVMVVVAHGGQTQREKLQSVLHDVESMLKPIKAKLLAANANIGAAPYFQPGETEVASLPTKGGMVRVTDRHVFVVNKTPRPDGSPQVDRTLACPDVTLFDFYMSTMGSMQLVLGGGGTVTTHTVPASAMDNMAKARGVYDDTWKPSKMAAALAPHGRPAYLEGDEQILFSARAARSQMGAIKPSLWVRLTNRRLLVLERQDDGSLGVDQVVARQSITGVDVSRHTGDHGQLLNLVLEFQGAEPFTLWLDGGAEEAAMGIAGAAAG